MRTHLALACPFVLFLLVAGVAAVAPAQDCFDWHSLPQPPLRLAGAGGAAVEVNGDFAYVAAGASGLAS